MRFSEVSLAAIAVVLTCGGTTAAWAESDDQAQAQDVSSPDRGGRAIDQVSRTDIVVTANSREELRNSLSPGSVSVIYPDDTRGEHKALPDLLDQVPGVYVRRVNGTGQYTTTSIRGSAPSQVNIYVDGVPHNTSGEVAADISTIPISNIERIEVYRGLVPARFSGSPLGGAINIVTKRATGLGGAISGGLRSYGGWQASANLNVPLFGGNLLLGADAEGSKGDFQYTNYQFEQVKNHVFSTGADGQPNTPYSVYDVVAGERVYAGAHHFPTERTRLNNSYERYNAIARWTNDHFSVKHSFTALRRFRPPTVISDNIRWTTDLPAWAYPNVGLSIDCPNSVEGTASCWTDANSNPRKRQRQRQHDLALGWQDNFGGLEASASLTFMDRVQQYDNLDRVVNLFGLGGYWTRYHTQRIGGQIDLAYTLGEGSAVTQRLELHAQGSRETMGADASGADCDTENPSPNFYCRFRRHLVNFQAQNTITIHPLGGLQITPIVRVERLFGPVLSPGSNQALSGSGDYKWQPTWGISAKKEFGDWLIFAGTGTYNRYPNFYEIYGDGISISPGRDSLGKIWSNLTREHGRNSDVGIGWNGQVADDVRASFRGTLFARKAKDEITLYATQAGGAYINSGDTLTRGAELEGNLIFGKFADLQAAWSYQNGKYVEGTYYWFGGSSARQLVGDNTLYRMGIPRVAANARLNLHFLGGALTAFGEVRHQGRRYLQQRADDSGTARYMYEEPLTTFDLGGHYKFGSGVALSLGVTDIFNAGPRQQLQSDLSPGEGTYGICSNGSCSYGIVNITKTNVYYPQQGRTFYVTLAKSFGADQTRDGDARAEFYGADAADRSWTGFYVGGSLGRGWASVNRNEHLLFDGGGGGPDGVFGDRVAGDMRLTEDFEIISDGMFGRGFTGSGAALGTDRSDGIAPDRARNTSYGLRFGYDRQIGTWLAGAVAEWSHYGLSDSVSGYGGTALVNLEGETLDEIVYNVYNSYSFSRRLNSVASLRLRGGLTLGRTLIYGTGGLARADLDESFATTDTMHDFEVRGAKKHRLGRQLGGGIETRIAGPFTLGLEYLHARFKGAPVTYVTGYDGDDVYYNLGQIGFQRCETCQGTDMKRSLDTYSIRAPAR